MEDLLIEMRSLCWWCYGPLVSLSSSVEAKWQSPKSSQLVFGIETSQQFTNWLCLHHCRNVSVTIRLEPCWSARPRLSLFSHMDLTISLKVYFGAGQTHFWMTHIIVWVCQFCRYQWNFCYSLFDSSLPLFARKVAMRDAQMVLELQGERCPE